MSGFLKNLKGLFIATDEEMIQAETAKQSQSGKEASESMSDDASSGESMMASGVSLPLEASGEVNQEFLDILLDSMTKSNQQGYDYLEYKQALQSLKKMDMDEATRFQSAFAMAETMGSTKSTLIESAGKYLDGLKQEQQKFLQSVANQRRVKIDERKQELLKIDEWIKAKQDEIELLKKKIEEKEKSKAAIQEDLAGTARKIDEVEEGFQASYAYLSGQIKQDLDKINNILK